MPEQTAGTFTQSPAATAFSTLYGRVANYIKAPSDTDALTICKQGLNGGIKRLNTRNWAWARVAASITFVAGESGREYQLGSTFKAPRSFELLDSSSRIVSLLGYRDPKSFDLEFPNRALTTPTAYTVFNEFDNGYLTLNAAPQAGWLASYPTGRLRFFRRTALLSSDGDLFAGPTEAEEFLVWYARAEAAAHFAPDLVRYAESKAEQWWIDLVRDDVRSELTDW